MTNSGEFQRNAPVPVEGHFGANPEATPRPLRQDARDTTLECYYLRYRGCLPFLLQRKSSTGQGQAGEDEQMYEAEVIHRRLIRADSTETLKSEGNFGSILATCDPGVSNLSMKQRFLISGKRPSVIHLELNGSVLKTHHRVSAIGFFWIDQYEETSHAKYLI
ncbi:hypothetical protein MAR_035798 [Mya arenaria]|uniref:Uncharacterized protein n=1 Tax=Mya arenaria TaxID=6604 RepID=A0ABY7EP35_MYAAR|nr:hypothetical protein MAR_035798 [Mya arenaria]